MPPMALASTPLHVPPELLIPRCDQSPLPRNSAAEPTPSSINSFTTVRTIAVLPPAASERQFVMVMIQIAASATSVSEPS